EWVSQLTIDPAVDDAARAGAVAPLVKSARAPASVHWGEPIEVVIAGSYPTPNWRCVGVDARFDGDARTTIVLAPLSAPPKDTKQLQVLPGFEVTAKLNGLAPGRYTLRVVGRGDVQPEPLAVAVTPARAQLELAIRGGILGLDDHVRVFSSGVAVIESSRFAPPKRFRVLD